MLLTFLFFTLNLVLAFDLADVLYVYFHYYLLGKKLPENVNPRAVFANNELDLRDIQVYGFDYDYTLANYEVTVENLIYDLGKNVLVSKYRVSISA